MKQILIFLTFLSSLNAQAGEKISALPLSSPSAIATTDSLPYVNSTAMPPETDRIQLSDLPTTPAFQSAFDLKAPLGSPTFTGTVTGSFTGPLTGNASTATQLASSPTQCSSGQYATGIDTFANLTCAAVVSLPSQSGQSGNYLTTNGTTASWAAIPTVTGHDVTVGSGLAIATGTGVASALNAFSIGIASGFYLPSTTDQTNWNAKQAAGNYITALTGDGTASGAGSAALTLATVNSTPGTYGDASHTVAVTTNGKGLTTASAQNSIQIAESQVTSLVSDLSGKQATGNYLTALTGDGTTGGFSGGSAALTLATVNSGPGLYGDAANTVSLNINAKGLITASAQNSIQIAESQVTSLVSDLAAKQASLTFTAPLVNTTNTITVSNYTGDAGSGGTKGTVPAPATGDGAARKLLGARGSFATAPPGAYAGQSFAALDTSANSWAASKPDNYDAENSVGDWVAYANTAAAIPVTMAGGSPNTTCARNTSSPLDGTADFLMTLTTGASRQGEGCSLVVNIPVAYRGKAIRVSFPYITTGTIATGDIVPYAYDVTNSSLLAPSTKVSGISGTAGTLYSIFSTQTSTAQLRIGLHIARTSTAAATVEFDDVQVAPDLAQANVPMGDWSTQYAFTTSGMGTITSPSTYSRRVGDSLETEFTFNTGTLSSTLQINLPSSISMDTSKFASTTNGQQVGHIICGGSSQSFAGSGVGPFPVFFDGSTTNALFISRTPNSGSWEKGGNGVLNNSAWCNAKFTIPISGWSSGGGTSPILSLSDHTPYTPTYSNLGTVTGTSMFWRRVGDSVNIRGYFTMGTGSAAAASFSLPSGLVVDTSKTGTGTNNTNVGTFWAQVSGSTVVITTGADVGALFFDGSSTSSVFFAYQVGSGQFIKENGSNLPAATVLGVDMTVPVSGWTSTSSGTLTAPRSETYVDSGNGHGATNTKIRRFSNTRKSVGSDISYADDSNNGGSFTINTTGIYCAEYADGYSAGYQALCITVNDSVMTATCDSPVTYAQGMRGYTQTAGSGFQGQASWCGNLNVGDIVRAHDRGTSDQSDSRSSFSIVRVSN